MNCSIDACDKPVKSRGWCNTHYNRWHRIGNPVALLREKNKGFRCYAVECEEDAVSKKLCQKHYQRLQINGDPDIVRRGGINDTRWTGGRHVNKDGYIDVWVDPSDPLAVMCPRGKNYVREHRLVVARSLGRPLLSTETVHHINGDRRDNSIENLQLRSGSHGQGVVLQCNSCGSHDIKSVTI